jgi:hypothetical protein
MPRAVATRIRQRSVREVAGYLPSRPPFKAQASGGTDQRSRSAVMTVAVLAPVEVVARSVSTPGQSWPPGRTSPDGQVVLASVTARGGRPLAVAHVRHLHAAVHPVADRGSVHPPEDRPGSSIGGSHDVVRWLAVSERQERFAVAVSDARGFTRSGLRRALRPSTSGPAGTIIGNAVRAAMSRMQWVWGAGVVSLGIAACGRAMPSARLAGSLERSVDQSAPSQRAPRERGWVLLLPRRALVAR